MKIKIILYCLISIVILSSCFRKPCEQVTKEDIVGIYISMNSLNNNKQYLEAFEDGTLYMLYCDEDVIIEEWGAWKQIDGCRVRFNSFRWFNSLPEDTIKSSAFFDWIDGVLSMGEDSYSFKKVRRKPKLNCTN